MIDVYRLLQWHNFPVHEHRTLSVCIEMGVFKLFFLLLLHFLYFQFLYITFDCPNNQAQHSCTTHYFNATHGVHLISYSFIRECTNWKIYPSTYKSSFDSFAFIVSSCSKIISKVNKICLHCDKIKSWCTTVPCPYFCSDAGIITKKQGYNASITINYNS